MVLLDVVYNHFGPDGNYLHVYAPQFFDRRRSTPWGAAIDFDGGSAVAREFFIHNALYWLEEFRFDGLRLDAVHAIIDDSRADIVARSPPRCATASARARTIHLVLENDRNDAPLLARDPAARRAVATRSGTTTCTTRCTCSRPARRDGYYADYADGAPAGSGARSPRASSYQGERSALPRRHRRGSPSGAPAADAPS